MSLKDRLMNDYKEAMKSKDAVKKNTINLARAAIKQIEIDTRAEATEEDVINVLSKQVKMRKDALEGFEKAGRTDLVEAYEAEMDILSTYLPKQMSEEEILQIVKEVANVMNIDSGKENMGKLMGAAMSKVKGKADGGLVRKIVENFLV